MFVPTVKAVSGAALGLATKHCGGSPSGPGNAPDISDLKET